MSVTRHYGAGGPFFMIVIGRLPERNLIGQPRIRWMNKVSRDVRGFGYKEL